MAAGPSERPVIAVVGLGPARSDLMTAGALELLRHPGRDVPVFFRTAQHPAATELLAELAAQPHVQTFDSRYVDADTFDAVYESIAQALLSAAAERSRVVYAVPGSPLVAERTVELLRSAAATPDPPIRLEIVPGLSFADLAWSRLAVDPVAEGVRLVDGLCFARSAAGDHGPLLVAQCFAPSVLSEVKLALEDPPAGQRAILLHHLGLEDEQVVEVAWEDLDRALAADHLTSLYIEHLESPVAGELVGLVETVATLRRRCPWDRQQTHHSLLRHLVEETYEAIEALENLGDDPAAAPPERVAHAEEELGDLLCHVVFHATLAREEGLFDLADVARAVDEKLIRRHPHVFADTVADSAGEVEANWERNKRQEKPRQSLLEGVPRSMPSLARAATIERKLAGAGLGWVVDPGVADPVAPDPDPGDELLALARRLASAGRDPEGLVRSAIDRLVEKVADLEALAAAQGVELAELTAEGSSHLVGELRGLGVHT